MCFFHVVNNSLPFHHVHHGLNAIAAFSKDSREEINQEDIIREGAHLQDR